MTQTHFSKHPRRGVRSGLIPALVLGCGLIGAAPSTVQADHQIGQPYRGGRTIDLDVHAGVMWYGLGVLAGARVAFPLVQNGFISSLDNAFYLTIGADFYYINSTPGIGRSSYDAGIGFPITAHWEFYFSNTWSAFAEVGVNIFLHPRLFSLGEVAPEPAGWFITQVGGRLHLSNAFAIVLRVGNPYVALGATFSF